MDFSTFEYDMLVATGFANGDLWESEKEIREYFRVENFDSMFPDDHNFDQDDLDTFAEYVIEKQLHCRVTYTISDGNATVEVNNFDDCFAVIDSWYEFLQEEHEDLAWDFSYYAETVDELNDNIAIMENEIAEQLGFSGFQGHGNYFGNAATQMGLNLTVKANFPKE